MSFHEVAAETIERLWALHVPKVDADGFVCRSDNEFWPCPIVRWMEDRQSRWVDRHRGGLINAR